MRYDESGKLIEKFILNNDPYSKSKNSISRKKILAAVLQENTPHGPYSTLV